MQAVLANAGLLTPNQWTNAISASVPLISITEAVEGEDKKPNSH